MVRRSRLLLVWLAAALLIAGLLGPLASSFPDGLERTGEELGFMERAIAFFSAPLADYSWPGMPNVLSTALAGVVGVVITLALATGLARLLRRNC